MLAFYCLVFLHEFLPPPLPSTGGTRSTSEVSSKVHEPVNYEEAVSDPMHGESWEESFLRCNPVYIFLDLELVIDRRVAILASFDGLGDET